MALGLWHLEIISLAFCVIWKWREQHFYFACCDWDLNLLDEGNHNCLLLLLTKLPLSEI